MRMAALIALPCGAGLFALGGPIVKVVTLGNVDASIAGPLLSILGIASAFVCIQTVATAILQANGIVNLPILTMIIGGVSKVIVSYTLVGNPRFMIYGAPAGTLTCFAVVVALNLLLIEADGAPRPPVSPGVPQAPAGLCRHGGGGLGGPRLLSPVPRRVLPAGDCGHRRGHPGGHSGLCGDGHPSENYFQV